jgi:hypothetical protein
LVVMMEMDRRNHADSPLREEENATPDPNAPPPPQPWECFAV